MEIQIDGGTRQQVAYGTTRPDTAATCGDDNNGFGYTFNWNRLGNGSHNLRVIADGTEFANVNFTVTTLRGVPARSQRRISDRQLPAGRQERHAALGLNRIRTS